MCTSLSEVPDYEVLLNECVMLGVYPGSTHANKSPIFSGKSSGPYGTPTSPNEPVSTWLPSPTAANMAKLSTPPPSSGVSSGEQSPNPNHSYTNYNNRSNSFVTGNNVGSGRETPTATALQESARQRNSIFNLNPLASENDAAMENNLFNVLSPENTEAMSPATSYQENYGLLSCLSNDSSDNDEEQKFHMNSSSANNLDRRLSMIGSNMSFAPSPHLVSEMISNYKQQQQQNSNNDGKINKPKRKTRLCKLTLSEKSERRKRQNRLAASRCRKKKQAALTNMEDTANCMKKENDKLRAEMAELKKIISDLQEKQKSSFTCPRKCCQA